MVYQVWDRNVYLLIDYSPILNFYQYCGNEFNFKSVSTQIISSIPQQTTQNESETDQMDSFNESDLQLADETLT